MSVAGIMQGPVPGSVNVGYIGDPLGSPIAQNFATGLNAMGVLTDTWTITRNTANATYGPVVFVDPNGTTNTYTFTVAGSTTALDSSVAELKFAQDYTVTDWYNPSVSSNVVTMTNTVPGASPVGTWSTTDANSTVAHSVTGTDGTSIVAGRAVFLAGRSTDPGATLIPKVAMLSGAKPNGTALAKQVQTDTVGGTWGTGDTIQFIVNVPALNIYRLVVPVTAYATSEAATLTAAVAAFNTQVDLAIASGGLGSGVGIVATTGTHTVVFTADIAGYAFSVDTIITNSNPSGSAVLVSSIPTTGSIGDPATDASAAFVGIAIRQGAIASSVGADNAVWPSLTSVGYLTRGKIRVANTDSPNAGLQAWVIPTSGATDSTIRFSAVAVATAVPISKSVLVAAGYESGTVAYASVNGG